MKLRLLALAAAFSVTSAASHAAAAPRGLTVEDMVKMERVGSPELSPDASKVIYTVRSTDKRENRGHTEVWMLDLRTAHAVPQRLTHADASSSDPDDGHHPATRCISCPRAPGHRRCGALPIEWRRSRA